MPYSPATGLPIEAQTVSQMVDRVMAMPEGTRFLLLAPVVRGKKGEFRKELAANHIEVIKDTHGKTSHLSASDIEALTLYLLSLE